MTDQFTYLKHRVDRLESRVQVLEKIVRPNSTDEEAPIGPPPAWKPQDETKSVIRNSDLNMIEAVLWSIYDFVTKQSIGRTNDYKDVVDIKDSQAALQQTVSEIRDDVQTIITAMAETG